MQSGGVLSQRPFTTVTVISENTWGRFGVALRVISCASEVRGVATACVMSAGPGAWGRLTEHAFKLASRMSQASTRTRGESPEFLTQRAQGNPHVFRSDNATCRCGWELLRIIRNTFSFMHLDRDPQISAFHPFVPSSVYMLGIVTPSGAGRPIFRDAMPALSECIIPNFVGVGFFL